MAINTSLFVTSHNMWEINGSDDNNSDFTFWIQHARDVQVFLGYVESQVQVLQRIVLCKEMKPNELIADYGDSNNYNTIHTLESWL